jgi:hypothetical protein
MPSDIRGTRGMAGLVVPPLVRGGLTAVAFVTGDARGARGQSCPVTGAPGVVYWRGGSPRSGRGSEVISERFRRRLPPTRLAGSWRVVPTRPHHCLGIPQERPATASRPCLRARPGVPAGVYSADFMPVCRAYRRFIRSGGLSTTRRHIHLAVAGRNVLPMCVQVSALSELDHQLAIDSASCPGERLDPDVG